MVTTDASEAPVPHGPAAPRPLDPAPAVPRGARKLRVLHLIHHLELGGAEVLLTGLLPRLDRTAFAVHAACVDRGGPLVDVLRGRGVPTHVIGRRGAADLGVVGRPARLLRDLRIDLVNTHAFSAGFWGRLAARQARTPLVVATMHATAGWRRPLKHRLLNRLLLPGTDRLVAVSRAVKTSLIEREHVPAARISVIPNGIDPDRLRTADAPAALRASHGIPAAGHVVGMVARCRAEKGGPVFIAALAHLVRAGRDIQGVLVGDGPALAEWRRIAADAGLGDRLRFAGSDPDVARWLGCMDVLVCPSIEESFGLVALEGLAAGVPVVASRVGGLQEILADGRDARLVDAGDARATAAAVAELIDRPALARELVRGGRRKIAEHYAIDGTAARYAALYRDLAAGSSALSLRGPARATSTPSRVEKDRKTG